MSECISCGEPLDYPSGDGCASMRLHKMVVIPAYPVQFPWSDEVVRDYYDMHMDITLREMARKSGHPVEKLKQILMGV